ncbi:CRISPR-associated protein Cas4 [Coriobacteriales bacterium OH1046]|nr:CRISPR-associated protein Cas4 [Coriobacteriales bacterium OH1046]
MYADDEFLALSGIQHFAFCRRQWGLIHIEQVWKDNVLTVEGSAMHERAHDETVREHRGDMIIERGLAVHSNELGVAGKCDVIEFHRSSAGHPLAGEDGLWTELPVEYKYGRNKVTDEDRLQLCAEAMCLEEMFSSNVPYAYLYYGKTRSRELVSLTDDLREKVRAVFREMHTLYDRGHVPRAGNRSKCRSCSLKELCLPKTHNVSKYIAYVLGEGNGGKQ